MNALAGLVPVVPGLVALAAALLLAYGAYLTRSDGMAELEVTDLVLLHEEERRSVTGSGPISRLGALLVPALRAAFGPAGLRWLQRQVQLAGRPKGMTVDTVLASIGTWVVLVSPLLLGFLLQLNLLGILLCVVIVAVLPLARLTRTRRLRREQIDRDLPDFLDILSVTVAAGVGFRPSLARVADRMGGPLGEEMTLTLNQIANGASRRDAFAELRRRTDSEPVAQFVTAFLQAEELGSPIVETLRQIALDMRRTSAQQMRRKAARVAPRVTLVTSLVIVPGALITVFAGLILGSNVNFGTLLGGR